MLFSREFQVALKGREIIQEKTGFVISDDEAGLIALHIHAGLSDEMVSIDTLQDDIVDADSVDLIPEEVLMRFIQELPDGYRTVFNLYTFEDKSHKEIAQLLGINERSSSSQYFRARSLLAKRINEYLKQTE